MTNLTPIDFNKEIDLSREEIRTFIANLEAHCADLPQAEIPLTHYFSKGVYAREIFIPKGTLIVGKIHRHQNMNIISSGEVSFLSIDGVLRCRAPYTFVASPGAKRVIYAHEDSVWTTIHGTEETDVEKIEDQFIAKSYDDLYLGTDRSLASVLSVLGFTEDQLWSVSANESDQVPFSEDLPNVLIADSKVHGKGVFIKASARKGDVIAPARISGKRTPAGRYANHSGNPNAEMIMRENGDVDLAALHDIEVSESPIEILTDYYFNFTNTRGQKCLGSP